MIHYKTEANDKWRILAGDLYSGQVYDFTNDDYAFMDITRKDDGGFLFTSTKAWLMSNPALSNVPFYDIFDVVTFETIRANAKATQTVTEWTYQQPGLDYWSWTWIEDITLISKASESTGSYQMVVNIDKDNNTFEMLNLGHNGFAVDNQNQPQWLHGTLNPADGTLTFDNYQYAYNSEQWSAKGGTQGASSYFAGYYYFYLTGIEYSTLPSKPTFPLLTGTYTDSDEPQHNNHETAWVTNDGKKRTNIGFTINLNPWTYYTTQSAEGGKDFRGLTYENTEITGGDDVTCQVELTGLQGSNEKGIGCVGELKTTANPQYVDHYEIHVVPGAYSSINDPGFIHHLETGHQDAASIHDFSKGTTGVNLHTPVISVPATRSADDADATLRANDYSFVKFVPYSSLDADKAEALKNAKDLTYFVKTVYKPETNLAPTFHSMQTITKGNMTSIDSMLADSESADATPEYYNLQGIRVLNPEAGQVYIRRTGTSVAKVRF